MIKKLINKLICRYIVKDLKQLHDISEDKKMKAYAYLYQNVDMMKMLENILIADTKEMMAKDWMTEKEAFKRYGMFERTASIKKLAEYYYKEFMRTK